MSVNLTTIREKNIIAHGYGIYSLSNGNHAVADPRDNEDGYYLELGDYDELIKEAHDWIFAT